MILTNTNNNEKPITVNNIFNGVLLLRYTNLSSNKLLRINGLSFNKYIAKLLEAINRIVFLIKSLLNTNLENNIIYNIADNNIVGEQ